MIFFIRIISSSLAVFIFSILLCIFASCKSGSHFLLKVLFFLIHSTYICRITFSIILHHYYVLIMWVICEFWVFAQFCKKKFAIFTKCFWIIPTAHTYFSRPNCAEIPILHTIYMLPKFLTNWLTQFCIITHPKLHYLR